MAEPTPGQNTLSQTGGEGPFLNPQLDNSDEVSLEGIKQQYTDLGSQYNDFVQNAYQNVGARQVEHIGNNFGQSPYNESTYYEPAASDFASAMRQEGTQQAFTVGMERGKKAAEENLKKAQQDYSNAVTAYQNYQQSKNTPTMATIDEEELQKQGLTKEQIASIQASANNSHGSAMDAVVKAFGLDKDVKDWNIQAYRDVATNSTLNAWGIDRADYDSWDQAKKDNFWANGDVGRFWSNHYINEYYNNVYDAEHAANWNANYQQYEKIITDMMNFRDGGTNWSEQLLATDLQVNGVDGNYDANYLDVISADYDTEISDEEANNAVSVRQVLAEDYTRTGKTDYVFTINGKDYSEADVLSKLQETYGSDLEVTKKYGWLGFTTEKWLPSNTKKKILEAFGRERPEGDVDVVTKYSTVVSANDVASAAFGVDVETLKKYVDFRNREPEKFNDISRSVAASMTNLNVIEVADGQTRYHTKDGWKVLDEGTLVFNVPQAVLDDEGNILDPNLKKIKELYAEEGDPTMDNAERERLINEYHEKYAKNIALATMLSPKGDTFDSSLYRTVLACTDSGISSDTVIMDGKTKKDIVDEFNRLSDEEKYNEFSKLMYNANRGNGYFVTNEGGQLTATNVEDKNGTKTIGRYNEGIEEMDESDATAKLILLMTSIDDFNQGKKDGNINPGFLEADGSNWWDTTGGKFIENLNADMEFVSGATHAIFNVLSDAVTGGQIARSTNGDIGKYLDIIGEASGVMSASGNKTLKEAMFGEELSPDSIGYDNKINDRNSQNLSNAINPLTIALFNLGEKEKGDLGAIRPTDTLLNNVSNFASDAVAFGVAEGAEAILTAGVSLAASAVKTGIMTTAKEGIKAGAKAAAKTLTREMAQKSAKEVAEAAAKAAKAAVQADDVAEGITKAVAKEADDVAEDAAKVAAKETEDAAKAAKTTTGADLSALKSVADQSTEAQMKVLNKIANTVQNYYRFGEAFAKRALNNISDVKITKMLASSGVENVTDAMVKEVRNVITDSVRSMGAVTARQAYQNAFVSAFTGLSPDIVGELSDDSLKYFSKLAGDIVTTGNTAGFTNAIGGGKGMSLEGFKKNMADVITNLAEHGGGSADEAIRELARNGWESKRLAMIASREARNLVDDTIHDVIRGYTMPGIDNEGNPTRVTVDEYFSDPSNLLLPLGITTLRLGGGKIARNIQGGRYRKQIEKLQRALSSTDIETEEYQATLRKLQKYSAKSRNLANRTLDRSLSYEKLQKINKESEELVTKYSSEYLSRLGLDETPLLKNINRGDYTSEAEYNKARVSAVEELNNALSISSSEAITNYVNIYEKTGGGRPNTLSTLDDLNTWGKITRAAHDAGERIRMQLEADGMTDKLEMNRIIRKHQIDAVVEEINGAGTRIENLRSSMTAIFDMYDVAGERMLKNKEITIEQYRPGYISEAGLRVGEQGDGVTTPHRGLFMAGKDGGLLLTSPDPAKEREIPLGYLLNAAENGETEATWTGERTTTKSTGKKSGKKKSDNAPSTETYAITTKVNPQGLNMIDGLMTYLNSSNVHRYFGKILGAGNTSAGAAALQSGFIKIFGAKHTKTAAAKDLETIAKQINELKTKAESQKNERIEKYSKNKVRYAKRVYKNFEKTNPKEFNRIAQLRQRVASRDAEVKSAENALYGGTTADTPSTVRIENIYDAAPTEIDVTTKSTSELGKRMSPHVIKFKSDTTVTTNYGELKIPAGTTVEDAFQKIAKKSEKGTPPGEGSIIPTNNTAATQEVYDAIFMSAVGEDGVKYVSENTPVRVRFTDRFDKGNTSSANFWNKAVAEYRAKNPEGKTTTAKIDDPTTTMLQKDLADIPTGRSIEDHLRGKLNERIQEDIKKVQSGDTPKKTAKANASSNKSFLQSKYDSMIAEAAKQNGQYTYDLVYLRAMMDYGDSRKDSLTTEKQTTSQSWVDENAVTITVNGEEYSTAKLNFRRDKDAEIIQQYLEDSIYNSLPKTKSGKTPAAVKRVVQNVVATGIARAKDNYAKLSDTEVGLSYITKYVSEAMPEPEVLAAYANSDLPQTLASLYNMGVTTPTQIKEIVAREAKDEVMGLSSTEDSPALTALMVADDMEQSNIKFVGAGDYDPDMEVETKEGETLNREDAGYYGYSTSSIDENGELSYGQYAVGEASDSTAVSRGEEELRWQYGDKAVDRIENTSRIDYKNPEEATAAFNALADILKRYRDSSAEGNNVKTIREFVTNARKEVFEGAKKLALKNKNYRELVQTIAAHRIKREMGSTSKYSKFKKSTVEQIASQLKAKDIEDDDFMVALGVTRKTAKRSRGISPAEYDAAVSRMNSETSFFSEAMSQKDSTTPAKNILEAFRKDRDFTEVEDTLGVFGGSPAGEAAQLQNAISVLAARGVEVNGVDDTALYMLTVGQPIRPEGISMVLTPEGALVQSMAEKAPFTPDIDAVDLPGRHVSDRVTIVGESQTPIALIGSKGDQLNIEVEYTAAGVGKGEPFAALTTDQGGEQVFLYVTDNNGKYYSQEELKKMYPEEGIIEAINDGLSKQSGENSVLRITNKLNPVEPATTSSVTAKPTFDYSPEAIARREALETEVREYAAKYEEEKKANQNQKMKELSPEEREKILAEAEKEEEKRQLRDEADKIKNFTGEADDVLRLYSTEPGYKEETKNYRIEREEDEAQLSDRNSQPTDWDEIRWNMYLQRTSNQPTLDDSRKTLKKAQTQAKRAQNAYDKYVSSTKIGKNSKTSIKKIIADLQKEPWEDYLDADDTAKLKDLKDQQSTAEKASNGESSVYHSLNGTTYIAKGARFQNHVSGMDFLKSLGYDPNASVDENGNVIAREVGGGRKAMQKQLKKDNLKMRHNIRKGTSGNIDLPTSYDEKTAGMSLRNALKTFNEASKHADIGGVTPDDMWVDKGYSQLMMKFSDNPLDAAGGMAKVRAVGQFLGSIQNFQLAGGWGPFNALNFGYTRAYLMENPARIGKVAKMFVDFRNNKAAVAAIQEQLPLLQELSMEFGDASVVTDLFDGFAGRAAGEGDGVISNIMYKASDIMDRGSNNGNKVPNGFRDGLDQLTSMVFEDPTFKTFLPFMRAQMMIDNYNSATRKIERRFEKKIGKGYSAEDLHKAALSAAYARTMKFWSPEKFWKGNYETGLRRIRNDAARRLAGEISGEGNPTTILDLMSNAFFALRYKQSYMNRTAGGAKAVVNSPIRMIRTILGRGDKLDDFTAQLVDNGAAKGVIALIAISVAAKAYCDAMGIPNAWDDFTFEPQNDQELFHVPSVLMKMQTAGQIWLPNATREDGTPYIDPNKQMYGLDPMFSMFSLPNSVARAVNRAANGDTQNYKAPQSGIPNWLGGQVVNPILNSSVGRAISDEIIGSNLLSPLKAFHEVLTNSTYFGNNIWERKYLPDGTENPNYDPQRNITASVFHLMGLDTVLDPNGYNRWVKGANVSESWIGKKLGGDGSTYVKQDQTGTVSGAGILQHEYLTAAFALVNGDLADALVEGGELPIKTKNFSGQARTELNTTVKNTLDHYGDEYRAKIAQAKSVEQKDKAYAEYTKKAADEMARWSKKYDYLLGENQELVASATRMAMCMTAGEYDDNLAYLQNAYWRASQIAQIESSDDYWLNSVDIDEWIANGGTAKSLAEEKDRRSQAYNQALDEEYKARQALRDAGFPAELLEEYAYEDLRSEQRNVSKKIYRSIMDKLEKPVGEFADYKELQQYYEELIANASTTKSKAKLANKYNDYIFEAIAPAVNEYGAAILNEATYNGKGITSQLADYIIVPADKYYSGKNPRSSYIRDHFHVGYQDSSALPSDKEVKEKFKYINNLLKTGKAASAQAIMRDALSDIKSGRLYASDIDFNKMVRLQSKLRSKQ